ncbi:hypothetical protein C7S16_6834 [Burkholderia thailandensis]|uniref:Uncharacterized protein n=1 Tax=Burkholderia thailandensis TaxID=57975 RepID=A0AAW9CML7_BURTH|nr:hypothetical protein [Burkholderia thailandensis]MDW9251046.1 hypothetical protein [Burkholderia thailandensis]
MCRQWRAVRDMRYAICDARCAMRDARCAMRAPPIRDAAPLAGSAGMCIEV